MMQMKKTRPDKKMQITVETYIAIMNQLIRSVEPALFFRCI